MGTPLSRRIDADIDGSSGRKQEPPFYRATPCPMADALFSAACKACSSWLIPRVRCTRGRGRASTPSGLWELSGPPELVDQGRREFSPHLRGPDAEGSR